MSCPAGHATRGTNVAVVTHRPREGDVLCRSGLRSIQGPPSFKWRRPADANARHRSMATLLCSPDPHPALDALVAGLKGSKARVIPPAEAEGSYWAQETRSSL